MIWTIALALGMAHAIRPHLPGFGLISSSEIRRLTGRQYRLSEDGKAIFTWESAEGWESAIDLRSGNAVLVSAPGDILFDQTHWITFDRSYSDLSVRWDAQLVHWTPGTRQILVDVVDTLPHPGSRPRGSFWRDSGGVRTLLLSEGNQLWHAQYRWGHASVQYMRIGKLPEKADGWPATVEEMDRSANRAIFRANGRYLWRKGRRVVYLGHGDFNLWQGRAMRFHSGLIQELGAKGHLSTVCTGWRMLGMNSTGTCVAFRHESDGRCFLCRFRDLGVR